jgi:hypothetical protein
MGESRRAPLPRALCFPVGKWRACRRRFSPALSQSHARSSTIFVDELDARAFESASDYFQSRATWLSCTGFELVDGDNPNARFVSEILLIPAEQAPRRPGLFRRNHAGRGSAEYVFFTMG